MSMGGMLSCLKKDTSPFKECKVRPRHVPSHVSALCATASQHAPSVWVAHTHHLGELVVLLTGKAFSEHVGWLVLHRDVLRVDLLFFDLPSKIVILNINMFGAIMEFWVLGDHDR